MKLLTYSIFFVFALGFGSSLVAAELADLKAEQQTLRAEGKKLRLALNPYVLAISANKEFSAKKNEALKASRTWKNAAKNHPAMKEAMAKSAAAQKAYIKAGVGNSEPKVVSAALAEYTRLKGEEYAVGKKDPELNALRTKALELNKEAESYLEELLAKDPASAEIQTKLNANLKKQSELRKAIKEEKAGE